MKSSITDFDFSHLTATQRLLLAQELLDSVYDDVASENWSQLPMDQAHDEQNQMSLGLGCQ